MYEAKNPTVRNWITLNQTMQRQTKACIAKLSCEICVLLEIQAVQSGNSLQMLRDSQSMASLKVNKSTRENRALLKLNDTPCFLGLCPSNFLKEHDVSEAIFVSLQATKHQTWCSPQIEPYSINAHHRKSNFLRYAPENKPSPRVIRGKWLLKN